MQEEEPEEEQQATPRPDRAESPLGEGVGELLAAELTEVAQRGGDPALEVGDMPIPVPDVPEPTEQIDPRPIWREPTEVGMDTDPFTLDNPIEEMEALPIPIPGEGLEMDEVSVLPLPVPDPALGSAIEEVSASPLPIPEPPDVGVEAQLPALDGSSIPLGVDEVSSLPLPLPDPGMEAEFGEVGVLPIPTPEPDLIPENDLTGLEEEPFEDLLE